MATLVCLCLLSTAAFQLQSVVNSYNKDCITHDPKIFTIWSFKKVFADPCNKDHTNL